MKLIQPLLLGPSLWFTLACVATPVAIALAGRSDIPPASDYEGWLQLFVQFGFPTAAATVGSWYILRWVLPAFWSLLAEERQRVEDAQRIYIEAQGQFLHTLEQQRTLLATFVTTMNEQSQALRELTTVVRELRDR